MAEDFTMYAGDDKRLEVTVLDEDGVAVTLAGAQAIKWKLAKSPRSAVIASHSLVDGNVSVIDAAAGRFNVLIDPADTESLSGLYYHEAELTDSAGNVGTCMAGTVTIRPTLIDPS
jgi:hypothetical protein